MSILVYPTSSEVIRVSEGPPGPIGPQGPVGTGTVDLNNLEYITFTTGAIPSYSEGRLYWDSVDHTLAMMTEKSNTTLQIGQESFVRAVNKTTSILQDGKVVYINGAQGNRPTAEMAIASNHDHTHRIIGVTTADIPINQEGYITTFGLVRGLNTSSHAVGNSIYLSPLISGEYISSKPQFPNYAVKIGTVLVSHSTQGVIFVNTSNEEYGRALKVENSTNATTLGSVIKKVEIFNSSGDSLGFVPIYDSIS